MPPYRGGASAGGRGGGGVLTRGVAQQSSQMADLLEEVAAGTTDLAATLGMQEGSALDKEVHQQLAEQVQQLAAQNAKLEIKRAATASALQTLAAQVDKKTAGGAAAAAAAADDPPPEEMDMAYFLEGMTSKLSSAMEGADEKALESQEYKNLMKMIVATAMDDDDDIMVPNDNRVSLKCPLTSSTFVDPVKNTVCGHTYGKKAILNHIRVGTKNGANSDGVSCPVAACNHKVLKANLAPDKDMMRRVSAARLSPLCRHTFCDHAFLSKESNRSIRSIRVRGGWREGEAGRGEVLTEEKGVADLPPTSSSTAHRAGLTRHWA
ncbi:unnamed protein product [Ectocarpus fasciculatus]